MVRPAVDPLSMNLSDPVSYPVDRVELSAVEKATRAPQKGAEISPAAEVAASKPVSGSGPVGFVDSAISVVDLETSSVAPLPGKTLLDQLDRECGHFTITIEKDSSTKTLPFYF